MNLEDAAGNGGLRPLSAPKNRDPGGMGISIASRWSVGKVHELDLNVTARCAEFPAATLIAEVQAPASIGSLLFMNHFPHV